MNKAALGREHFNLYYIFKEEKQQKSLPENMVKKLCEQVILKAKMTISP